MARKEDQPALRVQVYFENPKLEAALRREARVAKLPLSRAAEHAIARGLLKRPSADPEDRLLALDRALRDHMRATQRDMTIVQELLVEFARAFFARLPDSPGDQDPLLVAAVEARIERMLDAAAYRLVTANARAVARSPEHGDAATPGAELRAFQAAV